MWAYAHQRSPFNAIRLSFDNHPKLAPGSALHSLLAFPEDFEEDNSPSALFSRLFDLRFQMRTYSALPDIVALRNVCAWILDYMDRKQSAADEACLSRILAGDAWGTPLYSHEEPIANPPAFAWGLFKSGVPQRELGLVYTNEPQQPSAAPALPSSPPSDVSDTSTDAMPTLLPQAWEPLPPAPTDMAEQYWAPAAMPTNSSSESLADTAALSGSAGSGTHALDIMSVDDRTDEQPHAHCFNVDDLVTPELTAGTQLPMYVSAGCFPQGYCAGGTAAHAFLPPEPTAKAQTADDVVVVSRAEWEQVQRALDLAGALIACKLM